jgi:hypothetical protein
MTAHPYPDQTSSSPDNVAHALIKSRQLLLARSGSPDSPVQDLIDLAGAWDVGSTHGLHPSGKHDSERAPASATGDIALAPSAAARVTKESRPGHRTSSHEDITAFLADFDYSRL